MHVSIEDKEHEGLEQRQNSSSTEETARSPGTENLESRPRDSMEGSTSKLRYPLPPTEIHDGRLFRKVG
jgi:hypothetical protein